MKEKTTTLFIGLILILTQQIFAQKRYSSSDLRKRNTYADAVELTEQYKKMNDNSLPQFDRDKFETTFFTKLRFYNWDVNDSNNYIFTELLKLNSYNRIIQDMIPETRRKPGSLQSIETETVMSANTDLFSYPSPISAEIPTGNIESEALNAIGLFLAKRAKEEVMYYAIDRIFDIINDNSETANDFKILFKQTCDLVKVLKKNGVYYYSDFTLLRQMIENDLNDLPANFYKCIPIKMQFVRDGAFAAGKAYETISKGKTITSYINNLGDADIWQTPECKPVTQVLQIMSNAFKTHNVGKKDWLDSNEIVSLDPTRFTRDTTQKFFYGLLFQQFKNQHELAGTIELIDIPSFVAHMYTFNYLCQELNKLKDSIAHIPPKPDFTWYIRVTRQALDLLQTTNNLAQNLLHDQLIPNSVFYNSEVVIEIAQYINQQKYIEATSIVINYLIQNNSISPEVLRKINFFIQLANLKDSKGFEDFLDQYTAPIGSSSLKRNAEGNISINGYVGFNVFGESIEKRDPTLVSGIFAPIGLSFTPKGDFTFHLSIFDLGSLVNVKLQDDTTDYSGLKFGQFLSPGVSIFYNFQKAPLSIGIYACHINDLRDITYSNGTVTENGSSKNVWRYGATLLVDIPFYTLYNKPKTE